jgi:hypothetical protein
MSIFRIFKEIPPDEISLKFFSLVGIDTFDNCSWFPKTSINDEITKQFLELLPTLEPYYQDHKLFLIHRELNQNRFIQILRHLAKAKGIYLESKMYGKQRGTYYRLLVSPNKEANFLVTFS